MPKTAWLRNQSGIGRIQDSGVNHRVDGREVQQNETKIDRRKFMSAINRKKLGRVALASGGLRGVINRDDKSITDQQRSKRIPSRLTASETAKALVRRNTEEVQSRGNFEVFEHLFADDFVDHTPQPNMTPDKAGVRKLYGYIREAFPDFHAEIHWQLAEGDRVTTYKTYHGTHEGPLLGVAPTHRKIHFESVDVMRVRDGKIVEHWGVGNLLSLMRQIGGWIAPAESNK